MDHPESLAADRAAEDLSSRLGRIDGRGYKAYRDLEGVVRHSDGLIFVLDHAQADPFAAPSRCRVQLPRRQAGLAPDLDGNHVRAVATADFLLRRFATRCGSASDVRCASVGAEVLERSAVCFDAETVELRLTVSLPAQGRRVVGQLARRLLMETVPALARDAITLDETSLAAARAHADAVEDQAALRAALPAHGLVAFVADGAMLPRASGVSQRPLEADVTVPFTSPDSLRIELRAPHAGVVSGMGISAGVTLVCGGAFHGKSTLLDAVARSVYDHAPGDGRERCVTRADATKVRAESGRWVSGVDIRAFLGPLPGGRSTGSFSTENASGSTSQAASIIESIESGSRLLLLDEDTSAGNLLAQDTLMRELLGAGEEPIIHLAQRARQLHAERGVSTLLVLGSSGTAFRAADCVIQLVDFEARDVTARARAIADAAGLPAPDPGPWPANAGRRVRLEGLDASRGRRPRSVKTHGERELTLGRQRIDLHALEQLVDAGQLRLAGHLLARWAGAPATRVSQLLDELERELDEHPFSRVVGWPAGDLTRPRRQELLATLVRIRGLHFAPEGDPS